MRRRSVVCHWLYNETYTDIPICDKLIYIQIDSHKTNVVVNSLRFRFCHLHSLGPVIPQTNYSFPCGEAGKFHAGDTGSVSASFRSVTRASPDSSLTYSEQGTFSCLYQSFPVFVFAYNDSSYFPFEQFLISTRNMCGSLMSIIICYFRYVTFKIRMSVPFIGWWVRSYMNSHGT